MVPSAKEFGKKAIGYPEHTVPVVTVKDWFSQFNFDPIRSVRTFSSQLPLHFVTIKQVINYVTTLFPIIGWISRYS